MQVVAIQFLLRFAMGVAITIGLIPRELAARGFLRGASWCLAVLAAAAAIASYVQRTSVANWQTVVTLGLAAAVAACLGAEMWPRGRVEAGRLATYAAGLLTLLAIAIATPWGHAASGVGMSIALADLVSSGLLLAVTMSAVLLGLWHLNTPQMEEVPLRQLVWLMAAAVIVRALLALVSLAIGGGRDAEAVPVSWIFVVLRVVVAVLGWLMLETLRRETGKPPKMQTAADLVYLGLWIPVLGELASQLVSVEALYRI